MEERLRAELAEVTAERNAVQQRLEQVTQERDQEALAVQRLTVAHRNYERMLVHVLNQRNEAWHKENILRARQVELEQQLAAIEEYNDNLHEEAHLLNNKLNPLLPHDNDDDEEMGSSVIMPEDDDDDIEIDGPEDVPPKEEEDEELEPASDEDRGEIFNTDTEDDA
jgi:chromosome segregation ATPase